MPILCKATVGAGTDLSRLPVVPHIPIGAGIETERYLPA
jgi:hypothetical protein